MLSKFRSPKRISVEISTASAPAKALRGLAVSAFLALVLAGPELAHAKLLITPEKAMQEAWPESKIVKESILLSKNEKERAQKLAGEPIKDNVLTFYRAEKDGKTVGWGGLKTSRVRTKDQTSIYMIDPSGKVQSIEVIAFYEPPDYLPQATWLGIFEGKELSPSLKLRKQVPVTSGATLTSQSITKDARLILAIWQAKFAPKAESK